MKFQCVITKLPTNKSFKGIGFHPDVLNIARLIRDNYNSAGITNEQKRPVTLRDILKDKPEVIITVLSNSSDSWKKYLALEIKR